jgi:hypothetical protein
VQGTIHHFIRCPDGETIDMLQIDGCWVCPVCGTLLKGDAPYDACGIASHDICPLCNTEYGVDDYAVGMTTRHGQWKRLRFAYLGNIGWMEAEVQRIADILNICRPSLDVDIAVYRRQYDSQGP